MSKKQIVGITLVRNEDIFVEQAVRNAIDFCDHFIIADHQSTDQTYPIVSRLASEYEKIELVRIGQARESHDLIRRYENTPTWAFAVDGDELYDPTGLRQLRRDLLEGLYDPWWVVFGNVLNAVALDREGKTASGYLAPPCRSMTKLYNFNAIERWDGDATHVFARGNIVFKPGYDASLRLNLHEKSSWEEASFRCIHTCFLPRSSADAKAEGPNARANVTESLRRGPIHSVRKLLHRLAGKEMPSDWKREKYMRGELTTVDATPFLGEPATSSRRQSGSR